MSARALPGVEKTVSGRLPDFPWDHLTAYAERARAHPDGIVDLSVGTPVDPTPQIVQGALRASADTPGYPVTVGNAETRQAAIDWMGRTLGVTEVGLDAVIPVIGSKELIASLAGHLGLGAGDTVAYPALAYPTYEVGAVLAGCDAVAVDATTEQGRTRLEQLPDGPPRLLWLNSPANPTGRVLDAATLREVLTWCRAHGVLLVSDECYVELGWDAEPVSVLHPDVCGGSLEGVLAVHSLSKRSNLAGYRCAFVAGDPRVVGELLAVRKNLGLQLPEPQQRAMVAALGDDLHVAEQREVYAARRAQLRDAFTGAGFGLDHSEGALYLWATRGEDCWTTVRDLAEQGILVAPGSFYGEAGAEHVRIAFTATDERVAAAAERLRA
ncbi:succinyldiaminopimelate transaminase [Nocardioidaceae bacterium]|nr:succinyldiaminopimelate transaminase [Nocardioidaceae bacterium]